MPIRRTLQKNSVNRIKDLQESIEAINEIEKISN